MNKATLIETLSDRLGGKRVASDAVDAVVDTITRAVASGERVAITGFGVFERVARPARTGRNPRTGASVKIKKTTVPKFKAGQHFKDVVSGAKKVGKAASNGSSAGAKSSGTAKSSATKSTAKKSPASKSTAKKAPASKAPASKSTAKKAPASKASASKSTAKKASASKSTKSTAKAPAKKTTGKKTTAKRTAKKS